eukprot:TRINITY_DN4953_c0_g1_i1.p1 TRINITY_DN4953_c0_g1~~TRINITY_DN4953_c0_g1_i1.p1  ORF type:complete len:144 (-),score=17.65 TRINITY_DN4953_c0_g1_i1:318-749(-)
MYFHQLGLSGKNEITSKGWMLKTFGTIQNELGFQNRIVEVLKIDIEGYEWSAIPEMLQSSSLEKVKQLVFEIHLSGQHTPEQHKQWFDVFNELRARGWRSFHTHQNPQSTAENFGFLPSMPCCYEVSFINSNLLKVLSGLGVN